MGGFCFLFFLFEECHLKMRIYYDYTLWCFGPPQVRTKGGVAILTLLWMTPRYDLGVGAGRCQTAGKTYKHQKFSVLVGPVVGPPVCTYTNTERCMSEQERCCAGGRRKLPGWETVIPAPVTKGISTVTWASETTADLPWILRPGDKEPR